jgi:ABC-type branched-subunit amino acid transport system substrate-binding protein
MKEHHDQPPSRPLARRRPRRRGLHRLLLPEHRARAVQQDPRRLHAALHGTFAQLGVAIENGVRMAINEKGGKLGGREIEWFKVDDESEPSKGVENANRLVQRDKVDVLIGTVHSGVQMGIQRVARESGVLNLIPNAGVHAPPAGCARPTCSAPPSPTASRRWRWASP